MHATQYCGPLYGTQTDRKRLFMTALTFFGHTRATWAAERGISPSWLDSVCAGRSSRPIEADIDETIAAFRRELVQEVPYAEPRKEAA